MSTPQEIDEAAVSDLEPQDSASSALPASASDETDGRSASRRRALALGVAAATALLAPRRASAQRIVRPLTTRPAPPPASGDTLLRLVRRITNGVTEEELNLARSLGFQAYLEHHLNHEAIDDARVTDFVAANYPAVNQDVLQLYTQNQTTVQYALQDATLYRGAFSKRQLYERMVNFWSDHFNIYYPKVNYLKVVDDKDVIRKNALGSFPEMLKASAHSSAMLEYLDNTRSRANNVNQNYAREIMELHTLGVDGGYTQTDVEEVTRAFTGWTIQGRGGFRFDPTGHDFGAKTVLGNTIPAMPTSAGAQGVTDGERVLDILVAHQSTARFISYKMIRWLLRYDPPAALVDKVAETYTRTGGDIKAMIRVIMTPANLTAAPAMYRQPYHLMLASLRAAQPSVANVAALRDQLRNMGQYLFFWEDPDGYPHNTDWWGGLILQRWSFEAYLSARTGDVLGVDVTKFMTVSTANAIADSMNQLAFAGTMSASLKTRVAQYLAAAAISQTRVREAFGLALSSSEFQWF
jgi:uncharacterized protein (DUF1800 family)